MATRPTAVTGAPAAGTTVVRDMTTVPAAGAGAIGHTALGIPRSLGLDSGNAGMAKVDRARANAVSAVAVAHGHSVTVTVLRAARSNRVGAFEVRGTRQGMPAAKIAIARAVAVVETTGAVRAVRIAAVPAGSAMVAMTTVGAPAVGRADGILATPAATAAVHTGHVTDRRPDARMVIPADSVIAIAATARASAAHRATSGGLATAAAPEAGDTGSARIAPAVSAGTTAAYGAMIVRAVIVPVATGMAVSPAAAMCAATTVGTRRTGLALATATLHVPIVGRGSATGSEMVKRGASATGGLRVPIVGPGSDMDSATIKDLTSEPVTTG